MPEPDRAALRQLDADFAARLQRRDPTVLADIDCHFGPVLRHKLKNDSCMDEVAIEQILEATLEGVWSNYNGQSPVSAFYFIVAGRRRADRIRKWEAGAKVVELAASWTGSDYGLVSREPPPEHRVLNDELRAALEKAELTLTDRQRRAYLARFSPDRPPEWDKHLAREAGGTPQSWRKASSEAVEKVQASLNEQGFGMGRVGATQHVTAAKTTA